MESGPNADQALVPTSRQVSVTDQFAVPAIIEDAGKKAKRKFVEFFAAEIENDNTRMAYAEAVDRFLHWCLTTDVTLATVEPTIVASYFNLNCPETRPYKRRTSGTATTIPRITSKASKKQHLAAVRQMFDHLVRNGVMEFNPAASVRGPKLVVEKGKTPVLNEDDARTLFESIDVSKMAGLRDRALLGCMVYAFARVGAVLAMNVDDLYENGRTLWLRLHEKGGKFHEMPAHHKLAQYLDEYVAAAGIRDKKDTPLFRTLDRTRRLTERRMLRQDAWKMVKRRARQAGISPKTCCHTGRATGLTSYMANDGSLETARQMAAHTSSRTTKMYVRIEEQLRQEEVERVRI